MKKPDTALLIIKMIGRASVKTGPWEGTPKVKQRYGFFDADGDAIIKRAKRFLSQRKKAGRK